MPHEHYVYFHRDSDGNIFYVGMGTGRRAWSKDRTDLWEHYVRNHLLSDYTVEIHKDGLSQDEAATLENELMSEHATNLVNIISWGRPTDLDAAVEVGKQRTSVVQYVEATKPIEKTDPDEAIKRYYKALDAVRRYTSIKTEDSLVERLSAELDTGDPNIIDRLTLCLIRAGRIDEALEALRGYLQEYPPAVTTTAAQKALGRVEKALNKRSR